MTKDNIEEINNLLSYNLLIRCNACICYSSCQGHALHVNDYTD